jgi:hypothetical protein
LSSERFEEWGFCLLKALLIRGNESLFDLKPLRAGLNNRLNGRAEDSLQFQLFSLGRSQFDSLLTH